MGKFFENLFRLVSRPAECSERNRQTNQALEPLLPPRCLSGQQMGPLARFRLGRSRFSLSGCEVIAVYNACRLAGKPLPLTEICRRCEALSLPMLGGFWGCNPYRLGLILDACGLSWQRLENLEQAEQSREGILLLSFWNQSGNPFHGVHTVAVQPMRGIWLAYNRYGNIDRELPYKTLEEVFRGGKLMTGYWIR